MTKVTNQIYVFVQVPPAYSELPFETPSQISSISVEEQSNAQDIALRQSIFQFLVILSIINNHTNNFFIYSFYNYIYIHFYILHTYIANKHVRCQMFVCSDERKLMEGALNN